MLGYLFLKPLAFYYLPLSICTFFFLPVFLSFFLSVPLIYNVGVCGEAPEAFEQVPVIIMDDEMAWRMGIRLGTSRLLSFDRALAQIGSRLFLFPWYGWYLWQSKPICEGLWSVILLSIQQYKMSLFEFGSEF